MAESIKIKLKYRQNYSVMAVCDRFILEIPPNKLVDEVIPWILFHLVQVGLL